MPLGSVSYSNRTCDYAQHVTEKTHLARQIFDLVIIKRDSKTTDLRGGCYRLKTIWNVQSSYMDYKMQELEETAVGGLRGWLTVFGTNFGY